MNAVVKPSEDAMKFYTSDNKQDVSVTENANDSSNIQTNLEEANSQQNEVLEEEEERKCNHDNSMTNSDEQNQIHLTMICIPKTLNQIILAWLCLAQLKSK